MSEFNLNDLRNAFKEKDNRIPISSWDLTGALDQIHTNDPFSSNNFKSSIKFNKTEKEINDQYCQEVELIKKLTFPNAPILDQNFSNDPHERKGEMNEHYKRVHKTMSLWEKHVSPIIVKNKKVYIILPPRYVMEPAKIKSVDFDKFANDMLVHCAALKDKIKSEHKSNERKNLVIIILSILLLITFIFI